MSRKQVVIPKNADNKPTSEDSQLNLKYWFFMNMEIICSKHFCNI